MEIEKDCRELIEKRLFKICMEEAKDNTNPEIQALYKKLKKHELPNPEELKV